MSVVRLFLAGDSTMSTYDSNAAPREGWGQAIGRLLPDHVHIFNEAASGRSSKSFIHEGRLAKIVEKLRAGDYLLIQFGHNDQKPDEERRTEADTTYKACLLQYIDTALNVGAIPILITSVQRRSFDPHGELLDTHGDYLHAVRQLAEQYNVGLIDLAAKSKVLMERLGSEPSKSLFMWLQTGEYPNYPDGVEDNTHFCAQGAYEIAKLVVEGLQELGIDWIQ